MLSHASVIKESRLVLLGDDILLPQQNSGGGTAPRALALALAPGNDGIILTRWPRVAPGGATRTQHHAGITALPAVGPSHVVAAR